MQARSYWYWGLPIFIIAVTLWYVLPLHSVRPDLAFFNEPLHSAIEAIGSTAGLMMGLFLLNKSGRESKPHFFWAGTGFLVMAVLDGFHSVTSPGGGFVWLHSLAVLGGGAFFALIWFSRLKKIVLMEKLLPLFAVACALTAGILTLADRQMFPLMTENSQFTSTAKGMNAVSGILFLFGAFFFILQFLSSKDFEDYLFFLIALMFGLAGITFQHSRPWSDEWWFWHVLKLLSFFIVLAYLVKRHLHAQTELFKTNRALKMLSECNQSLVRIVKEDDLLNTVCSHIVDIGGYKAAWVGFAADDPRYAYWREEAVKRGYPSYISLPLVDNGNTFGALNIYSDRPDAFAGSETRLLSELAADISFGVNALRTKFARHKAEEEVFQLNRELENRVAERTMLLEAANKELEAFSYSVSHDLRAPLRGIDGFSHAILEDYSEKMEEGCRNYLNRIRAASQRMAQLIDDMLKLSRVTRSEMHNETVDLSGICRSIAGELMKIQPGRSIEFVIAPDITVKGDSRLLHIAFENLLGNAWKFTGKKGNARIEFGSAHEDGHVKYFIRDNGVGYDMAYADKLFGAFQRLHSADEFPGTGIGLATVQRIVNRHGGRVWAEGRVDGGAVFYFTLQQF